MEFLTVLSAHEAWPTERPKLFARFAKWRGKPKKRELESILKPLIVDLRKQGYAIKMVAIGVERRPELLDQFRAGQARILKALDGVPIELVEGGAIELGYE